MRRLGVYGENLPTKKDRSINAADFSIAGLYGVFNRKYKRVFQFRNTDEAAQVLGPQTNPAYYGWDSLNGFFANLRGQPWSIIVASYPGAGAARSSGNIMTYFTVKAAYQGEPEYGVAANRVAFTLTGGTAFSTTVTTAGNSAIVKVESVAGVRIGDVVKIGSTFHTVVDINESDNSITLADTTTSTIRW